METCDKKKFINKLFILLVTVILTNFSYADVTFKNLENKQVPYLDFFLLKFENKLIRRAQYLSRQLFATRVQYSAIASEVKFEDKKNKFLLRFMQ